MPNRFRHSDDDYIARLHGYYDAMPQWLILKPTGKLSDDMQRVEGTRLVRRLTGASLRAAHEWGKRLRDGITLALRWDDVKWHASDAEFRSIMAEADRKHGVAITTSDSSMVAGIVIVLRDAP